MKKMIQFDLSIYSAEAIREAVRDFHDIATVETSFQESICLCKIKSSKYDINLTEMEFANYILDKTVSKGWMR